MYAEHAGRSGKVEMDDIILAVQARVGWEFGGRVPKEYILTLANQTNAIPLPSVPEVFGVRLPPASECLTSIDFNLVPNKPPPSEKLYDEEIEEVDESDEDDEDMEPAAIPSAMLQNNGGYGGHLDVAPAPPLPPHIGLAQTASYDSIIGIGDTQEEGSEGEDEDGLFAGGDDEDESGDDAMDVTQDTAANGVKRKLVEDNDYD